jgi:hypothetical protein
MEAEQLDPLFAIGGFGGDADMGMTLEDRAQRHAGQEMVLNQKHPGLLHELHLNG